MLAIKRMIRTAVMSLMAAVGLSAPVAPVVAEPYPTKPLRMIVPFAPGGSNDIIGRVVAQGLGERLGKAIVVENRAGAGGIIGADLVAKAPPDGYTILLISSAFTMNSALHKNLAYNPAKDFAPIAMLGSAPTVLAVHPSLGVSTVKELVAKLKEKPGQLRLSASGVGSYQHLVSELFRIQSGTDFLIVQYKGGGPALNDLVAGHVDFSVGTILQTLPFIQSGQVKALGMGGRERLALLPDVPTIREAGLPDYEATNWWGLMAPAGTPADILERLATETKALLDSPELTRRFDAEGAKAVRMTTAEFAAYIAAETKTWAGVVKDAKITAE